MLRHLRNAVLVMLALDGFGLACVLLTWGLAGGGEGGMGPYLQAVGRAAVSLPDLIVYCALIGAYSAVLELALRRLVQEPLARAGGRVAGLSVPAAAIAYALTHAVYHPAGVVYAGILGLGSALAYAWCRDWRALGLWHVQWNALAIVGTLILALWGPGDARTAALVAYKADRIDAGQLVYADGWGWVDRSHMPHDQLDAAERWAGGDRGARLELTAKLSNVFGGRVPITRTYTLSADHLDRDGRWAVACAVVLDFHTQHERAQSEQPWWTGTPMSGFQFDDLPSVLRACLDRRPGAEPMPLQTDRDVLHARWEREGAERVVEAITEVDLPLEVRRAWAWVDGSPRPPS